MRSIDTFLNEDEGSAVAEVAPLPAPYVPGEDWSEDMEVQS